LRFLLALLSKRVLLLLDISRHLRKPVSKNEAEEKKEEKKKTNKQQNKTKTKPQQQPHPIQIPTSSSRQNLKKPTICSFLLDFFERGRDGLQMSRSLRSNFFALSCNLAERSCQTDANPSNLCSLVLSRHDFPLGQDSKQGITCSCRIRTEEALSFLTHRV
jgi:hypothetical protein